MSNTTQSQSYSVSVSSTQPPTRQEQTTKSAFQIPPLLTIAQELRDIIFAHVFNTADPSSTIDLRIIPCDNIREDIRAGTLSLEASPPTKHPLLVCRQLHTEQKQAHAAAYRRYWASQRFHITTDRPYLLAKLRLAPEPDLRHIRCLSIAPMLKRTRVKLLIKFRFEVASKWIVTVERCPRSKARPGEEVPWQLTECARRDAFLRSLKEVMDGLRKNCDGPSSIDPAVGQGLNSNEMYELSSLVWVLIWNPDGE
ncbi:hypothetical protein MBLNU13_g01476t1 [Cladosporium sp. NU13]